MICADGLPEADRPSRCGLCPSERIPHRHGKFMRWLFTVEEALHIPVFRFLCPDCIRTICVLPGFVEAHHQSSVDVKEEVVRTAAEGRSLPEVAVKTQSFAGGGYSEKTLWRWFQRWQGRREAHEERLWSNVLHSGMDVPLPQERRSGWRALFVAWASLNRTTRLFYTLLRLDRSSNVTVTEPNPTIAGHGWRRSSP